LTLVPSDDKRQAVNTIDAVFSVIEDKEENQMATKKKVVKKKKASQTKKSK